MGYKESLPSLNSGECLERDKIRYEKFQANRHAFDAEDEMMKEGSIASGISTESDIGLNITR